MAFPLTNCWLPAFTSSADISIFGSLWLLIKESYIDQLPLSTFVKVAISCYNLGSYSLHSKWQQTRFTTVTVNKLNISQFAMILKMVNYHACSDPQHHTEWYCSSLELLHSGRIFEIK